MSGQTTPAGWYPDPQNAGQQRYWDGTAWSEATQAPPGGAPAAPGFGQAVGYGYAQGGGAEQASVGTRFVAALIDGLIIGIPLNIVLVAAGVSSPLVNLLVVAAQFGYFGFFESKPEGQTIGKKAMKIQVVDATTMQPGIEGRAWTRSGGRVLSGLVCALGFLWILWDKDKMTWHDKMATTRVVKVRA
jgi:uncharacterized RDD family membrane protein YckC